MASCIQRWFKPFADNKKYVQEGDHQKGELYAWALFVSGHMESVPSLA